MEKNYRTFPEVGYKKVSKNEENVSWVRKLSFSMVMFPFQLLMIALFAGFADYHYPKVEGTSTNYVTDYYPIFQNVHVMICFAIGFLLVFLKKYGYASVTYNFMLVSIVAQWSTLVNPWMRRIMLHGIYDRDIGIGLEEVIEGDVTAVVIIITWCVVIGKTSRLQLVIIALVEPVVYAISQTVISKVLYISDTGGAVTIHFFAAYYGLAISYVIGNHGDKHKNESTTYQSDMFSMVGSIFLWVYWPSFNAVELGGKQNQQMRAIVNTYYSMAACVVATIGLAPLLSKRYKINMIYVQNATLAGGIGSAAIANMLIRPWGAVLVGFLSGIITTLGYAYLSDIVQNKLKIHDTAGVHNLHALPGILSGVASAIAVVAVKPESYPSLEEFNDIFPMVKTSNSTLGSRTVGTQALYQLSAIPIVFVIAVVGGLINGLLIMKLDHPDEDELYDESGEFEMPIEGQEETCNTEEGSSINKPPRSSPAIEYTNVGDGEPVHTFYVNPKK